LVRTKNQNINWYQIDRKLNQTAVLGLLTLKKNDHVKF